MTPGSLSRAVVFALEDLPLSDQRFVAELAKAMGLPGDAAALAKTPFVLTREGSPPAITGLRSDAELAAAGPSVMLLWLRLLTADALDWPELSFLGCSGRELALYAADPRRSSAESLRTELSERGFQVRGLGPRGLRLVRPACERVPVLGFQVPMLGGKLSALRDERQGGGATRLREKVGEKVGEKGMTAMLSGHQSGRYALRLHVAFSHVDAETGPDELPSGHAELAIERHDAETGATARGTLHLSLADLSLIYEAEQVLTGAIDDEALRLWLSDLLPVCLLVGPSGDLLLVDLFHLGLSGRLADGELRLRCVDGPATQYDSDPFALSDEELDDASVSTHLVPPDEWLLDPRLWPPDVLAGLVDLSHSYVAEDGATAYFALDGIHDGEPVHGGALVHLKLPAA